MSSPTLSAIQKVSNRHICCIKLLSDIYRSSPEYVFEMLYAEARLRCTSRISTMHCTWLCVDRLRGAGLMNAWWCGSGTDERQAIPGTGFLRGHDRGCRDRVPDCTSCI